MLQELYNTAKTGEVDEPYREVCSAMKEERIDAEKETAGWIIFYYLKYRISQLPSLEARKALKHYLDLNTEKPSFLHSQILNQAIRLSDLCEDFKLLQFVKLWNPEYLTEQALQENIYNGKTYPSLYEKIVTHSYRQGNSLKEIIGVLGNQYSDKIMSWISNSVYYDVYVASKNNEKTKVEQLEERYLQDLDGGAVSNEAHSKILNSILWSINDDNLWKFKEILEKWGFDNFREEDWKKNVKDGREYPSLAEKAISKYIDSCKRQNKPLSEVFQSLLSTALDKDPGHETYIRAIVEIDLEKGNREEALDKMKSLILTSSKYYLWSQLSELVEDKKLQMACLCKALLLQKDDDFTGKIRLKLAALFLERNETAASACELKKYEDCYVKHGWKINPAVEKMKTAVGDVAVPKNNMALYEQYAIAADEFIYDAIPSVQMVYVDKFEKVVEGKTKLRFKLMSADRDLLECNPKKFGIPAKTPLMTVFDVKLNTIEGRNQIVYMKQSNVNAYDVLASKCAVVDNVNSVKRLFHCIVNQNLDGIVHTDNLKFIPEVGDLIDIIYLRLPQREGQGNRIKIVDFRMHEGDCPSLKQIVSGLIRIKTKSDGKMFGFVGDQYVHAKYLIGINDGDDVTCTAIFKDDRWNVVNITKN